MELEILREEQQDAGFFDSIAALPEGEHLRSCLQCGTCGGTCPVAPFLPHTPRKVFAMVRAGMKRPVLESLTPWVCASCYQCTVNCPAGIHITEIMYALKRRGAQEGITPPDSDAIRFLEAFTDVVCKYGRAHEMGAVRKYMMFRHPLRMAGQAGAGLSMMLKGRMPLRAHKIKDLDGFGRMVAAARKHEEPVR
jgi:heterodisulfide reductase subunit C